MAGAAGPRPRRAPQIGRQPSCERRPRDLLSLGGNDDDDPCAEAAELGINTAVRGPVLASLRRNPPPSFDEAQAQVAALEARWDAGAPIARGSVARSGSRGRSEAVVAAAILATNGNRPPRPLISRGASPNPSGSAAASPSIGRSPSSAARPLRNYGSEDSSSRSVNGNSGDSSLVASMAARLQQVEKLNQQLSAKVTKQTEELDNLQNRLRMVGNMENAGVGHGYSEVISPNERALQLENAELKQQLVEIKQFLAGYGLKWVPQRASCCEEASTPVMMQRQVSSSRPDPVAEGGGVSVDIEVIRGRVEGLNASAEEMMPEVVKAVGGAAQLAAGKMNDLAPLTFFQDGIKLADYAFMPYGGKSAQELIKNILDGVVPKVLRDAQPHGIPLKVVDRTGNAYAAWFKNFSASDPELADGGERLRPNCGRAVVAPACAKSPQELLVAKLPERVVTKNGRVCEVRGAIADRLGLAGGRPDPDGLKINVADEMSFLDCSRAPEAPTARLIVKLEAGQRAKLCMEPCATLGDLWNALAKWRSAHGVARVGADGRRYVLRQAFPPRAFEDMSETLEAACLVPSATLFVAVLGDAPAKESEPN